MNPETRVVSVYGNAGRTWNEDPIAIVDEENPEAEIAVGELGMVKLSREQIFGAVPTEASR